MIKTVIKLKSVYENIWKKSAYDIGMQYYTIYVNLTSYQNNIRDLWQGVCNIPGW